MVPASQKRRDEQQAIPGGNVSGGRTSLKDSEAVKSDWQAGSVVSPPYFWYHQHFNTGTIKARYLAITEGDFSKRPGIPLEVEEIEADQEHPAIKKRFERELHKS